MSFDRLIAILLNISCPGCGLIYLDYKKLGGLIASISITALPLLSWSRTVLIPSGALTFFLIIITLGIYSLLFCIIKPIPATPKKRSLLLYSLLIVMIAWLSSYFLLKQKNQILGIDIYFIPSMSMYPALQPGDVILTDTWDKQPNKLKVRDIVVFNFDNQLLVKRIAEIKQENNKIKYFVLGDNLEASQDSRTFGAIYPSQIEGKATQILFSFNAELWPRWSRFGLRLR